MCGIVGAVAERNVVPILLAGLERLEYRGYDSAGIAVAGEGQLQRRRCQGKVAALQDKLRHDPLAGQCGIAHTRWATHGLPTEINAHPHLGGGELALVHNGIIENASELRQRLQSWGITLASETDTEVVAQLVAYYYRQQLELLAAVRHVLKEVDGAYALAFLGEHEKELVVARRGSPLVIGVGVGEHFVASDVAALLPVTQRFIFLQDGDIATVGQQYLAIYDSEGLPVTRPVKDSQLVAAAVEKNGYRHFMLKEIHEQPQAIAATLQGRLPPEACKTCLLQKPEAEIFHDVDQVLILACGTSYHAGMVARYWIEEILGLPCQVEIASEFRYRCPVIPEKALLVAISQSGETADTLSALQEVKAQAPNVRSLAICNVPESSLVREADAALMTEAGPEIGVASTKAFTTQLTALALLLLRLGSYQQRLSATRQERITEGLRMLPGRLQAALAQEEVLKRVAESLVDKEHALFLGRGPMFPIALEGALKLKEISYIHAEAYPAGELKHGPLALVDEDMPVIAVAPQDDLLAKLKANLEEVRARGGQIYVLTDRAVDLPQQDGMHVVPVTSNLGRITSPIIFTVPLQLLAYYVAVLKGTDVDQPRNLAKSVTVE